MTIQHHSPSQLSQVRHSAWKRALFPLAKAALERKDYGNIALIESETHLESLAWTVANYAATDIVMRKRTPLLDMDAVRAVDPFAPAIEPLPRVTTPVRKLDPAIWGEVA